MVYLKEILKQLDYLEVIGNSNVYYNNVVFDSRDASSNSLFVALCGTKVDGHKYIDAAIKNGANIIVCERKPEITDVTVTYVIVKNSHSTLAWLASNFYDNPSAKLKLIGVTGTNGKTTIATLLYYLFKSLSFKSGLLSTVENYVNDEVIPATHTTPDSIQINKLLKQMVDNGCEYCFMEISSHSIDQQRINSLDFNAGIFTNITHDHLDYHKTFKAYLEVKKMFFDNLESNSFALVNIDDKNGEVMLQNTKAKKYRFSVRSVADFKCKIIENYFDSMLLNINGTEVWTNFTGDFNASNLLAVYATASLFYENTEDILKVISTLVPVRGRFETLKNDNNITAIVDYAHTPDALLNILKTINKIKTKQQQLITVVGTGGNRDKSKRPVMAKIALENSDKLILTSDNPRDEDPVKIINDMESGISQKSNKLLSITDRKQAIKTACMLANTGDIILVAGKGHETYQEIKGIKYPFDDKIILKETLNIV